jgi:hypothetical protein
MANICKEHKAWDAACKQVGVCVLLLYSRVAQRSSNKPMVSGQGSEQVVSPLGLKRSNYWHSTAG